MESKLMKISLFTNIALNLYFLNLKFTTKNYTFNKNFRFFYFLWLANKVSLCTLFLWNFNETYTDLFLVNALTETTYLLNQSY